MKPLEVPSARRNASEHADWIELEALQSHDGVCSLNEFASRVHATATTEAMTEPEDDEDPHDRGGEQSYELAENAWKEIEQRHEACGGAYPFVLSQSAITLDKNWVSSFYIFQMLLSKFGHKAGPSKTYGDRLFESISTIAGRNYFGAAARSYKFGFPRVERTGFATALQGICSEMNSGTVELDATHISNQKDSHLDVILWLPFWDGRPSILIAFGQCATGDNWDKGKLTELQPENFREKWLREGFYPLPVRLFFVPHSIPDQDWRDSSIDGGIVFDRCRITKLTSEEDRISEFIQWTSHVASVKLGKK